MKISRRQFLKGALITGAGLAMPTLPFKWNVRRALAFYQSPGIPLFGNTLRGLGAIPVAAPDAFAAPVTGVTHYTINISQFTDQIVPLGSISASGDTTTLWGYQPAKILQGNLPQAHLGGIIVGNQGVPIQITFKNNLPGVHILPVDTTIPGANQAVNRAAVHLHGGLVPWVSDGGPFDWFTPSTLQANAGTHGLSFLNNKVFNPGALIGQAEYYYPLNQTARFMWYHDHAFGITRLNAYAGIASGMLIRDKFEANLVNKGLPDYIENGGNEIPLVFQDKIFQGDNILGSDSTWQGAVGAGNLWYAHTYEANPGGRWDYGPTAFPLANFYTTPLPDPCSIPEFFGDTMLVNGTTFPKATVQARRYRLRMLNACNARFLNLQLYVADSTANGITLNPLTGFPNNKPFVNAATGNQTWLQIGTEGGFLSSPAEVPSSQPFRFMGAYQPDPITGQTDPSKVLKSLLVAPAERPDLIVDFSGYENKSIILYSDAPAPYPSGDDLNDYFPGWNVANNPANSHPNGFGPNTRILMRFDVVPATGKGDKKLHIEKKIDQTKGIDPTLLPTWGWTDASVLPFTHRFLTLNEYFDDYGRLIQILGNAAAPYGSPYDTPANYANYGATPSPALGVASTMESVTAGATEVWEIYNTTGDVHPMHFHLVNVQLINRQLFSGDPSVPTFAASVIPPNDNELGWKETVQMYPGTVTRVIMKFDLPTVVNAKGKAVDLRSSGGGKNGTVLPSPRTGGNEYVWHCHILEHEEHDMMHALVVT